MLLEDPDVLVPENRGSSLFFPWRGVSKKLHKVAKYEDDMNRLEGFAARGPPLVKAFAATLIVRKEGKAPYLGALATPMGELQYAQRGKVTADYLIGVQHF